jgi:hypothetical protein
MIQAFADTSCAQSAAAMGLVDQSTETISQGVTLAQGLDHPFSVAHMCYNSAIAWQVIGDRDRTARWVDQTVALTEKYGFSSYGAGARFIRA